MYLWSHKSLVPKGNLASAKYRENYEHHAKNREHRVFLCSKNRRHEYFIGMLISVHDFPKNWLSCSMPCELCCNRVGHG